MASKVLVQRSGETEMAGRGLVRGIRRMDWLLCSEVDAHLTISVWLDERNKSARYIATAFHHNEPYITTDGRQRHVAVLPQPLCNARSRGAVDSTAEWAERLHIRDESTHRTQNIERRHKGAWQRNDDRNVGDRIRQSTREGISDKSYVYISGRHA